MRLALVSDIHGNLAALEAVIADLESRHIDQVVNLGDTLSGPLLPAETAQRLQKLAWFSDPLFLVGSGIRTHTRPQVVLDKMFPMGYIDA